ncbi:hypothetical protein AN958_06752, partial [Leucoagaricus sp. SymC.cos]
LIACADKILHQNFDGNAGFNVDSGVIDAGRASASASRPKTKLPSHIRRVAEKYNCPMPTIDVAHQHLLTARALHSQAKQKGQAQFESLDCSGLVGTRSSAGWSGFDRFKVRIFLFYGTS